ncbi:MAG: GAF domain-containing protein [Deltaproteobacteria bacterium]|nr:GAF domain-containing protein [Deltaproteobacteria bacterium]
MLRNQRLITVPLDQAQLQERNRALSVLLQLSNYLSTRTKLEDLLGGALELVMEQLGVSAGRLYLSEPEEDCYRLVVHRGVSPEGLETVPAGVGFTSKAARTRSFLAMLVEDLDDAERVALLASKGFKVVICLPLITRDQVIGVMNLAAEELIPLEMATIDLVMVMGNLVATTAESVMQAQELSEQARLLAEQKEAVQFFAYTACHDMKSPATGVHGLARMLAQRAGHNLDDKGLAIISQIEKAAQRIEDLAQEVNAYIRAKQAPLKLEQVSLGEVLSSVAGEMAERLEKSGVVLELPPEDVVLSADQNALSRAITNLVDNALKYGGPQLSRIRVIYDQDGPAHVFKVSDDGVGVPPELAEKCFTLFKRADTSQGTEGTGLGLAIVREIARRHGGQAWLETAQPQGACFCFSLSSDLPAETTDSGQN